MTKNKPKKPALNKYVRFTGIAFQMGLTIYLGNLLGEYLDQKYLNNEQLYTKICTLLAVFVSMFSIIMQVSKMSKKDD